MSHVLASLRFWIASTIVCAVVYPAALLAFALGVAPESARGSLLRRAGGELVGSALLAQRFDRPRYFWPRPSAVDYDAAGGGGSNLSPASLALAERARDAALRLGATPEHPAPAELVTASGSGLDPHIGREAALYQVARVAAARRIEPARVEALVEALAFVPGDGLAGRSLVNVLRLNLALDRLGAGS